MLGPYFTLLKIVEDPNSLLMWVVSISIYCIKNGNKCIEYQFITLFRNNNKSIA